MRGGLRSGASAGRRLVVVHVHVAGQSRALGEAHGAAGAAEGPLGRVAAQVAREVAADAEAAAAGGAHKGLLARVGAQVPLEVHLPVERLGAQGAREGPHPRVGLLVVRQVARAARHVAAVAARQPRLRRPATVATPAPREETWKEWRKRAVTRSASISRRTHYLRGDELKGGVAKLERGFANLRFLMQFLGGCKAGHSGKPWITLGCERYLLTCRKHGACECAKCRHSVVSGQTALHGWILTSPIWHTGISSNWAEMVCELSLRPIISLPLGGLEWE